MASPSALFAFNEIKAIAILCHADKASAIACIADYVALKFFLQHRITPSVLHIQIYLLVQPKSMVTLKNTAFIFNKLGN